MNASKKLPASTPIEEVGSTIDYTQLEEMRNRELQNEFQRRLESQANTGRIDSLREAILRCITARQYDLALSEIERYVDMKDDYPTFRRRVQPYVNHSKDIIMAIKAKRNFPGLSQLSTSKQQEIMEKVSDHFEELKGHLRRIERIEREIILNDLRSTVWVLKSLFYSAFVILAFGFTIEVLIGLSRAFDIVYDDIIQRIVDFIFGFF